MSDRYWSPSSRSALVHHCQTPPPRPRHAAAWAGAAGWRGKQEAAPAVGQWEWIAVGQWRFQYYRAVVDCRRPSVNSNSAKVSVRLSFWGCVKAELRNATEPQLQKRRRLGSASRKGGGSVSGTGTRTWQPSSGRVRSVRSRVLARCRSTGRSKSANKGHERFKRAVADQRRRRRRAERERNKGVRKR